MTQNHFPYHKLIQRIKLECSSDHSSVAIAYPVAYIAIPGQYLGTKKREDFCFPLFDYLMSDIWTMVNSSYERTVSLPEAMHIDLDLVKMHGLQMFIYDGQHGDILCKDLIAIDLRPLNKYNEKIEWNEFTLDFPVEM